MSETGDFFLDTTSRQTIQCEHVAPSVPKFRLLSYAIVMLFLIGYAVWIATDPTRTSKDPDFWLKYGKLGGAIAIFLAIGFIAAIAFFSLYLLGQFIDKAFYSIEVDFPHQILRARFNFAGLFAKQKNYRFENIEGFRSEVVESISGETTVDYIPTIYIVQKQRKRETGKLKKKKLCSCPTLCDAGDKNFSHAETLKNFLEEAVLFRPTFPRQMRLPAAYRPYFEQWARNAMWGRQFWRKLKICLIGSFVVSGVILLVSASL